MQKEYASINKQLKKKGFRIHKKKDGDAHILKVRNKAERIVFFVVFIFFVLYAVSLIYPFLWLIIASLKTPTGYMLDMTMGRPFAFPKPWTFDNYIYAFNKMEYRGTNFFGMFFNSLWQCALSLFCGLAASGSVAYVLSRFRFRGRNLVYGVIIFTMTVPIIGNTGGMYKLVTDLGIYNTPFYIICTSFNCIGLSFMILYGFFSNISQSYAEAVYIDGGGEWTVFLKIMIPQAAPAFLTLAIVNFIGCWNEYTGPLLYLPSFPTIASGMYSIKASLLRTGQDPIYYSAIVLYIIPVLVLFCCFSDVIMKNMSVGGLKG